jgi:hypothetical protein
MFSNSTEPNIPQSILYTSAYRQEYSNVRYVVFKAVTMKKSFFWNITPVALIRTDALEDLSPPSSG